MANKYPYIYYKNDTPLAEDELLLYALTISSFHNDTFTKMHSTEKYDKIVQAIDNIIGVHYSSNSVSNYFHRVRNNQVKGIGKTKGILRWTYFNNDMWNVMHSQGEVLQLLFKGNLLKENEKVSLLQQLQSTCDESMSQKSKKDDNQEAETILSETLEISKVGSIFDSPVLVLEWSFQECLVGNVKTIHFFCFGNCPGYAEKEVELNNNGKWCVNIDGIKREVDFEWTECPQDIKTLGDIPNLLNCLAKLSVCQECDYQKYETAVPPESEYGQPVFMTKDGTPAAFVERAVIWNQAKSNKIHQVSNISSCHNMKRFWKFQTALIYAKVWVTILEL